MKKKIIINSYTNMSTPKELIVRFNIIDYRDNLTLKT